MSEKKDLKNCAKKYIKCDRYFLIENHLVPLGCWMSFLLFFRVVGGIFWQNAGSVAVA